MIKRLTVILCLLLAACATRQPDAVTLSVSVAASLQNAMLEVQAQYQSEHPRVHIQFNFGGSGALQQQIEQGAPADVFLSAATKQMDALAAKGLIVPDTRKDLLVNQVVLIAPRGSSLKTFHDLSGPGVKVFALGDPASVPAGDYGKQSLQALGVWPAIEGKLVLAKDVRQVLSYIESGDADAGIVYATDARLSTKVQVVAVAPESTHRPIVYPVAVLKQGEGKQAAADFVRFLFSAPATAIFVKYGFVPSGK
jgi:molybdate transport system substrate-binding protein